MSTADTQKRTSARPGPGDQPRASPAFHWAMALLSLLLAGGVVQDVWAHNHGKVDQSFFTPWHAILYGSMTVVGLFLGATALLGLRRGYAWQRALPPGYFLSLLGVVLFAIGGVLDLGWHTLFGIEADTEALLSPTHLLLLASALLIVTGTVRAAWIGDDPATARGWRTLGPLVVGATAAVVLLGQFTQFASPMDSTLAAKDPSRIPAYTDIYVMNADGSAQTRITIAPERLHFGPAWSPDGRQLVFMTRAGDAERAGELWIADADGTHLRQLTHNGRKNFYPAWSPDGSRIAFNSQVGIDTQTAEIHVIGRDGRAERALTSGNTESYHPSWSPDGRRIVFGSKRTGRWHLFAMNADGSDQSELPLSVEADNPAWSHDGRSIAFVSDPLGRSKVAISDAIGGAVRALGPAGSDEPSWSPRDDAIVFSAPMGSGADIYRLSTSARVGAAAAPVDLTRSPAVDSFSPQYSPDGGRIAYSGLGHTGRISPDTNHSIGVADVIVQTVLLMGMALLLVRTWALPFGSMLVLFGLPSIAQLIMQDNYPLAVGVLVTGLVADLLLARLRAPLAGGIRLYTFAAIVPALYQASILATLASTAGLDWSVNMIAGSVLYAAATGLFLGFMLDWPSRRSASFSR